jgi:hypothetical protein
MLGSRLSSLSGGFVVKEPFCVVEGLEVDVQGCLGGGLFVPFVLSLLDLLVVSCFDEVVEVVFDMV